MNNSFNNEYNQNGYQTAVQAENEAALQRYVASVMRRVYGKMSLGLMATALMAFLVVSSEALQSLMFRSMGIFWVLCIVEIGLVIYLSARIDKMSTGMATAMFYLYSLINGVTIAPIFFVYTESSIATTFAITSLTFGAMSVFGYVTRQDLSKFGAFMFMAFIGLLVCMIVNIFLQSSMMAWCISVAGVLIFVGLTAWDTQAIKRMCAEADPSMLGKVATMGALTLYLDFINLFLHLLRILGSRN